MRLFTIIICVFGLFSCQKKDERFKDITLYLTAWQASDLSQTQKAEETYAFMKENKHKVSQFKRDVATLYQYLEKHPDARLKCRILMFDVLCGEEMKTNRPDKVHDKISEAIKLAHQLNDNQLLSEVYALAGQVNFEGGLLLYNIKALELQRKIGLQYFSHLQTRFFNISWALYMVNDFKNSVVYGVEGVNTYKNDKKNWDNQCYIFQLDIVGASYKALKKYDSAHYYYQTILDGVGSKTEIFSVNKKLWIGIAKGNIGHILALQNKTTAAIPLITAHLDSSLAEGYKDNAAMAQNNLSNIYLNEKKYTEAVAGFKKAYLWSLNSNKIKEQLVATKGIADIYKLRLQADSAFKYYNLYHQYRDEINQENAKKKLSVINAKIAFDDAQNNLKAAKNTIDKQRLTRNFILASLVLLTIIALLFYNKKIIQQKYLSTILFNKHQIALQEVKQAREQVASFMSKIVEKEKLINNLQQQLVNNSQQANQSLLQYTLVTDIEWNKFRAEFAKAYPNFLTALKLSLPTVNPSEERLAALLFLKLSSNQIAQTLGIAKDSVARSKRRLRQRLQLNTEVDLENFINQLG